MPYTLPLPENSGEVTPRNMGTQCENLEIVESGSENDLTIKRLWLRAVLKVKQYFGFGVRTSDPLLNVVKWIALITEVLFIIISKEMYILVHFNPFSSRLVHLVQLLLWLYS